MAFRPTRGDFVSTNKRTGTFDLVILEKVVAVGAFYKFQIEFQFDYTVFAIHFVLYVFHIQRMSNGFFSATDRARYELGDGAPEFGDPGQLGTLPIGLGTSIVTRTNTGKRIIGGQFRTGKDGRSGYYATERVAGTYRFCRGCNVLYVNVLNPQYGDFYLCSRCNEINDAIIEHRTATEGNAPTSGSLYVSEDEMDDGDDVIDETEDVVSSTYHSDDEDRIYYDPDIDEYPPTLGEVDPVGSRSNPIVIE